MRNRREKGLELFISGYSDAKIKEICGFRSELVTRSILTSVVNIGMIPYKGKTYQGKHEAVFDKDRFELGLELRKTRCSAKTYCITEPNLLTGLCYCGICGCKMRYQKWGSKKHKIYCCSRNKSLSYLPNYNASCNNSLEWADDIEKQVEEEILKISLDLSSYKPKEKATKLEIMQSQLEKEQIKLKRLYNLYADGNDTVLEMIKELESQIKEMKSNIAAESKNAINTQKKEFVYENIKKLADIWDNIDKKQKT